MQLGEVIDLPEYPDCEWHTSAHIIINLRMVGGVPSYTVWACKMLIFCRQQIKNCSIVQICIVQYTVPAAA